MLPTSSTRSPTVIASIQESNSLPHLNQPRSKKSLTQAASLEIFYHKLSSEDGMHNIRPILLCVHSQTWEIESAGCSTSVGHIPRTCIQYDAVYYAEHLFVLRVTEVAARKGIDNLVCKSKLTFTCKY